jgi:hypothetical protein
VIPRQVKAKRFGTSYQVAQIGVATQQILDQLASLSLLATDHLATGFGVSLGKRRHRPLHHLQHSLSSRADRDALRLADRGRELLPHSTGRREIQIDTSHNRDPLFGSTAALLSHRVDLVSARDAPLLGCIYEQR